MAAEGSADYMKEYTSDFTLEADKTAFIPIDLQYASASRTTGLGLNLKKKQTEDLGEYRFTRIEKVIIPNVQRMLSFFREHKLRIIYVTVGSEMPDYSDMMPRRVAFTKAANNRVGEREHEILDEIKPLPGELVINKRTSSAFNSSSIDALLRAMDIKYCLFAGVSTQVCVESTARHADDLGYKCILIEDACGSNKEQYHNNTLLTFQRRFGRVSSTEDVIAELTRSLQSR